MRSGIVILVIAFFAIIGTVVIIGRSNNGSSGKTAQDTKLANYTSNDAASVSWTMQGRLLGEDQRRAIRVTVTRNQRTVEILDGYEERTERQAQLSNSPDAFAAFVRALDIANFGQERTVKQADERGVCPLGSRFIYRVTDGTKEVMRTWSDNCTTADGPFGGGNTTKLIQQIFEGQITDYQKFVIGVVL